MDNRMILWRAETERTEHHHETPMTPAAHKALEFARRKNPGIGKASVLPAPKSPNQPMVRYLARDWWRKAEKRVGLAPKRGRGWHSVRRKFASDLKTILLTTLCQLGGWKTLLTVLMCYQTEGATHEAQRKGPYFSESQTRTPTRGRNLRRA